MKCTLSILEDRGVGGGASHSLKKSTNKLKTDLDLIQNDVG